MEAYPRKKVKKTVYDSIFFEAASQLVIGITFCIPSRGPVSAKEVNVLSPMNMSQH